MNLDFQKLSGWELTKAIYLVQQAKQLGMKLDGYGQIDVNPHSGYTYLWSEDYPFTLYMPIDCRLNRNDVWVLYTDTMNGEEIEERLSNFVSLDAIYEWVEKLEATEEEEL
jgi:hypothetical protein